MVEPKPRRYWVDENYGNDLNYGDFEHPYKTVEHAEKMCDLGDIICVTLSFRPEEKSIRTRCMVCKGKLEQEYHQTSERHVKIKSGSHCIECGLKYVINCE